MARPKKNDELRGTPVPIRFTESEKQEIAEKATLANLSMSEYCRRASLGRRITSHADEKFLAQLLKLGGLMKHLHNESGGMYSKETASVLVEIEAVLKTFRGRGRGDDA